MKPSFPLPIIISFLMVLLQPAGAQLIDTLSKNSYYEEEIIEEQYLNIYDNWSLIVISGGLSGNGYAADFDRMKVDSIGIFRIYRNDSLFIYGKITIVSQTNEKLTVTFDADTVSGDIRFGDMNKYIVLGSNTLDLYAPCCDRYNYHFIPKDQTVEIPDTIPPIINIISPDQDSLYFVNFSNPEVYVQIEEPYLKRSQLTLDRGKSWVYFGNEIKFTMEDIPSIGQGNMLVKAEDIAGNVAEDSVSFHWTHWDVEALAIPRNLEATNVTEDSIVLTWDYNESGICIDWSYLIFVDDELVDTSFSTSYTLTHCTPGTTYSIAVSALASCYHGSYMPSVKSDAIQVTTSDQAIVFGENEPEARQTVRIYPNPGHDLLIIEIKYPEDCVVKISDLQGKVVFNKNLTGPTERIDLSYFHKGIYFITVRSRDYVRSEKIIKM